LTDYSGSTGEAPRGQVPVPCSTSTPAPSKKTRPAKAGDDQVDDGEDAVALAFAEKHQDDLRYVAAFGKWMFFDGARWNADGTLATFDKVRGLCREKGGATAKTVAAVTTLARADRRLAATVDQWDADPWVLNTPTGTVDLRTGTTRGYDPADYLTKLAAASPSGECPGWKMFLDRVTGGDRQLVDFLQRMSGYALTGPTVEHGLFFLYGTGANGKRVFMTTIAGILADYQRTAPIETFTATTGGERHPTDLAGLRGARLVTATETEEGRRWAESRIKTLTGGDPVSARFMHQDFFDFTPQFKLVISGNHKPGLRSVNEAIRRRFHLVPFTVTIPKEERDPELTEKLKAEWPGILRWMIEGWIEWQKSGLAPPAAVTEATKSYLESEDAIGNWIEDRCDRQCDKDAETLLKKLFESYKEWAEANEEYVMSNKKLVSALEDRGFKCRKTMRGKAVKGLRLIEGAGTIEDGRWKFNGMT
jgi:putative DNA primase/helicase